ncbi:unnamed protein product, partial [Lampetra fluviatilis]
FAGMSDRRCTHHELLLLLSACYDAPRVGPVAADQLCSHGRALMHFDAPSIAFTDPHAAKRRQTTPSRNGLANDPIPRAAYTDTLLPWLV